MRSALFLVCLTAAAGQSFSIAGHDVPPGTRLDLEIPIAAGIATSNGDPATNIPVTIFHGAHAGRVLALTAGIHGYEYAPILAAQRLLERIDPKALTGTIVLVRIAHLPAFQQWSIFRNPYDHKNLNRVFPGSPDGTQSERIAHALTTEVIRRANFHIDLHSGDGPESLEPYAGIYGGKLATGFRQSKEIGLAFQLRTVVTYRMESQEQIDRGRSCNRQAVAEHIPTVLVECGQAGRRDEAWIEVIVDGVLNTARTLGMLPGKAKRPRKDTLWGEGEMDSESQWNGIFYPLLRAGQLVKKGDKVGSITDYEGRKQQDCLAPADGMILHLPLAPPIQRGDSCVTVTPLGPEPRE